jgi:hypothetical protein
MGVHDPVAYAISSVESGAQAPHDLFGEDLAPSPKPRRMTALSKAPWLNNLKKKAKGLTRRTSSDLGGPALERRDQAPPHGR